MQLSFGGNHVDHLNVEIRENLSALCQQAYSTTRINFIPNSVWCCCCCRCFDETTIPRPPIYRLNLPQSCRTFSKFSSIFVVIIIILQRSETFPFNQSTELLNKHTIWNSLFSVLTSFFSALNKNLNLKLFPLAVLLAELMNESSTIKKRERH